MVPIAEVNEFVQQIAAEFAPQCVILFGSQARQDAGPDSDVDLLVIMETQKRPLEQAVEIRQRISRKFPLDLLVKTPADVQRRLGMGDQFLATIMAEGKVLYDAARG
jgi:predicted nucleotidyltransferase